MEQNPLTRARARVAMALAVASVASVVWLATGGGAVSAHHPLISASASCADDGGYVIDYTSTAFPSDNLAARANPDVIIYANINGAGNTQVGSGAYTAPAFAFSGQFNVPADTTSLDITALANGTWGNGFRGGQTATTTVALSSNCTATTTSTTTTTAPSTTEPPTTTSTTTTTTSTTTTTTTTTPPAGDGCTPGYWKNHVESWHVYSSGQTVESVFDVPDAFGLDTTTLLQALSLQGGPGVRDAAGILLRAGTAALLNSAHSGVDYPRTTAELIAAVNAALASNDRSTILTLASSLDADNNLGCPLN